MDPCTAAPSDEEQAIIREEEALLQRARASITQALERSPTRPAPGDLRSLDSLRELRDEAASAATDDLPALFLELGVRQRLRERTPAAAIPDLDSPYLAHLRLEEGNAVKDYLLGRQSHLDSAAGVRIVDWRVAPVAQIFYRHREGDDYEQAFPGRVAEGVVRARRVVVIERGVLTRIVGDGVALIRDQEGLWSASRRAALSFEPGGAGAAARPGTLGVGAGEAGRAGLADVTALLDAEQYAAITAPPEEPLLVLGTAGSGKTTVALHRLAHVAARAPDRYPLEGVAVIVPEPGLARLSRRLLGPLGVGAVQVQTLDEWSLALARRVFGKAVIKLSDETPALVSSLKRHPALYRAFRDRFARLGAKATTWKGLRRRLAGAYTDRSFLAGVVTAASGSLPRGAVEETVRHTLLQLAEPMNRQLAAIVAPERRQAVDGLRIEAGTPDELAGTLDVEDLPILLFLRSLRGDFESPSLSQLVLDEAEDFALFELDVLGRLLGEGASVTSAGDEAQQTSSSFAGWEASLATLGCPDATTCRLAVSYRCPEPVVALGRHVLGPLATAAPVEAARPGAPVGLFHFPGESQTQLFLAGAVRDLVDREPEAAVAILARDLDAAQQLHALFADRPEVRLITEGDFSFEPGVDITDVESAKGLEFDYVLVPDATAKAYPDTADARRRLHVAITRTSHQLWILSSERRSPLLAGAPE